MSNERGAERMRLLLAMLIEEIAALTPPRAGAPDPADECRRFVAHVAGLTPTTGYQGVQGAPCPGCTSLIDQAAHILKIGRQIRDGATGK